MYKWLLFGHLLGVGLLLAGLGAHTVSVERLRHVRSTSESAALMETAELGRRLILVGGPLLIAAGLTMAIRSWSLTDGWIATSITLVVGQGVLGSVVDHRLHRLRSALGASKGEDPGGNAFSLGADSVLHAGNHVSPLVIAEILFLMSVKPTGWGILWSIVVMAVLAGLAVWLGSPRTTPTSRVADN